MECLSWFLKCIAYFSSSLWSQQRASLSRISNCSVSDTHLHTLIYTDTHSLLRVMLYGLFVLPIIFIVFTVNTAHQEYKSVQMNLFMCVCGLCLPVQVRMQRSCGFSTAGLCLKNMAWKLLTRMRSVSRHKPQPPPPSWTHSFIRSF